MADNKQHNFVNCEICGHLFDKATKRSKSSHNLCSNKCKYIFLGNSKRKHGFSNKEKLYNVWKSIRERCNNPNNESYKNYGGRGINLCSEWNDYINFRTWALNNGYKEDILESGKNRLSIERINNDGNYEPKNCKWADDYEQANNKRESIRLFERYKTCPACGKLFKIKSRTATNKTCSKECALKQRIEEQKQKTLNKYKKECIICGKIFEDRSGHFSRSVCCSRECANLLKSPIWEFNGKKLRAVEWAKELNITAHCLIHRKNELGWSIEKTLSTPLNNTKKEV